MVIAAKNLTQRRKDAETAQGFMIVDRAVDDAVVQELIREL